jgi:hypothetical protein
MSNQSRFSKLALRPERSAFGSARSPLEEMIFAALLFGGAVACGGTDPSDGAGGAAGTGGAGQGGAPSTGPLLPWATGNTWTYRVTRLVNGVEAVVSKVTTVGAPEAVAGTGPHASEMALKVVTEKLDGLDRTESWQALVGDKVLRYRERAYATGTVDQLDLEEHWDPHKIHIDGTAEHTGEGASWLETYMETKLVPGSTPLPPVEVSDLWSVVSASEAVEVPAGTFDAIHFRKVGSSTKDYWYARGVGKVKETGTQNEELESYEVGP